MFLNREDAALKLVERLKSRAMHMPLVLAIPRGGVITGAFLARGLNADLDIVLSRKLRAPDQPELAIGAISEDGHVYLNRLGRQFVGEMEGYLAEEERYQLAEISRRKALFRKVRPAAAIAERTVIVTDDGVATGSTMIAALQVVKTLKPRDVIVAVPVAPPDRLKELGRWCDEVVCLIAPDQFHSVGQFYSDFRQVEDQEVVQILRDFEGVSRTGGADDSPQPSSPIPI